MHQSYPEHKGIYTLSRLCDGRRFKFGYDRKKRQKTCSRKHYFYNQPVKISVHYGLDSLNQK